MVIHEVEDGLMAFLSVGCRCGSSGDICPEMEKWASTWRCKHSFPSEGMLPCDRVLIGWLHQLPSEEQLLTIFDRAVAILSWY